MAIDTGVGATYNENFPVRGVDQSSQGFRDNFLVIKRAIESLQQASSAAQSVLKFENTLGANGTVLSNISFANNAFKLPTGSPIGSAAEGMIRYNGVGQIYDGLGWRTIVTTDAQGGVTIPSTSYLKLPTGPNSQRPFDAEEGMIRMSTTTGKVEVYYDGEWNLVGEGAGSDGQFVDARVSGTLTLDNLAVNSTDAVNLLAMKNYVGSVFSGPHTQGITATFNPASNKVSFTPRNFQVELTGEVIGTGTVFGLDNVVIETVLAEDVGVSLQDVRDEIGTVVRGSIRNPGDLEDSETGILVYYDQANGTLSLVPRDFRITLAGDVTGSAVVHYLGNTTITTTATGFLKGLNVYDEGTPLGALGTITGFNFVGAGVSAAQSGNTAVVTINALTQQDVRDTIGSTVRGTIRDPQTLEETESGIAVFYDQSNNTLSLAPRTFDITLTGAVSGTATVSRLQSVTINTTTDLIKGVTAYDEGGLLGLPGTVKEFNFMGGGVTATRQANTITVNVPAGLSLEEVRDEVGSFVRGVSRNPSTQVETETGITVYYDNENNTLSLGVREFDITLSGAVSGTARVSRLNSVNITTTADFIKGVAVSDEGVPQGAENSVKNFNFVGNGVVATQVGNTATITVNAITAQNVRDTIGATVRGTIRDPETLEETESGIAVFYDQQNNTLSLAPRTFDIVLSGAVTGSATVSRLNSVNIVTTTDAIKGITAYDEGGLLGLPETIKGLNFIGGGVSTNRTGENLNIVIPAALSTSDVRDEVGSFVRGVSRNPDTQVETETGITVNYDNENNTLELGAREFAITLTGAVTGSGTVSRLSNTVIATTSDFIKGVSIRQNSVLQGNDVKTLNIVGGTASVANGVATIDVATSTDSAAVKNIVKNMLIGTRLGTVVSYDAPNEIVKIGVNPIEITLAGAVTGNGTILFDGSPNQSKVTIQTETILDRGVEVRDEGNTAGNSVTAINFVGGGVTSAVSVDGETATVYIPNSPANEKFILIDNGSANVPNARKLTAGIGITLHDGGPGGDYTISAQSDEILANTQFLIDGELVGERPTLNIEASDEIFPELTDDPVNNRVVLKIYSLNEGWHRQPYIDFGSITDKYGTSLDMGGLGGGILEADINLGSITEGIF